jgi:hypothetical protein
MQSDNEFVSFSEAYQKIIKDILTHGIWVDGVQDPNSVGSNFGKKIRRTKELLVYSFCVADPRRRDLSIKSRAIKKPFLLANFLWTLMGTRKGKAIIPFNEKGIPFLDDKMEFNSAIGPHIFKSRNNVFYELTEIEGLLRRDPTTRRAVFQFFIQKDISSMAKDVPCYNHMQFFIREGRLHAHVVMRSQNALMVLPYDFYFFSLFHEALSVRLALEPGKLYYTANSIHIYDDFIGMAESLRVDEPTGEYLIMKDFSDNTIKKLRTIFTKIVGVQEIDKLPHIRDLIHDYEIDEYWKKLLISHFISRG